MTGSVIYVCIGHLLSYLPLYLELENEARRGHVLARRAVIQHVLDYHAQGGRNEERAVLRIPGPRHVMRVIPACRPAEKVIDLPGMTKKQIFEKARQWLTYRFVSGRAVLDYQAFNTGRLIAKGTLTIQQPMGSRVEVHVISTIDAVVGRTGSVQ